MSKYDIKAVVCDYGIYENDELKIIVNSQANALLIKYVLDQDLQHKVVIADLLEKPSKKKRKFRAMTYKEHCKSLCLICNTEVKKMNKQEIIESINYCLECNNDSIPTTQKDLQTIKKALEKQIPKKPDLLGDGYDDSGNLVYDTWTCPCCETLYYDDYKFCPECGQAIDWSDLKNKNSK